MVTVTSHMGGPMTIQHDLFAELAPVVKRAAAKMARKYALRLSRRRVICPEDLENVGWERVLAQLEHIERRPTADERAAFTYTLVCNAIHNEMQYLFTSGDDAVRLTPQGTIDAGVADSSYDGGSTAFSTDDAAPIAARPSCEWWTPPAVWDEWQKMKSLGRAKLLIASGSSLEYVGTKWNEIPWDEQSKIEDCWLQTAKGVLRANRSAGKQGHPKYKPIEFTDKRLPHPDELGQITPPRLRAVSLLVYGGGFYTTGDSINSAEIAKILGKSARTVLRDHTELMKLWGAYVRADAVAKRDEKKFPRYPLHTNIAQEFSNMPVDAQMPVPANPVLESMAMTPARLRDLRRRMKKYHTDFSDATVTATIVTPRAIMYECGPRPSVFKIIAGFETPVPESDGHSQTIDYFYRKPSPNDRRGWIPIVCRDGVKQPIAWLHDWSASVAADIFGDKPEDRKRKYGLVRDGNITQTRQLSPLYLTTQRCTSVALYPGEFAREEKKTYCECPLCKYMRKEALQYFADARDDADGSLPINFSPLTNGLLHGQSRPVGVYRYKETHYLGKHSGHDVWGIAEEGLPYCYLERVPILDVNPPRFIAAPYPHDWSDTIEVIETTEPYHLSADEIASIADKEERELRARLRERKYADYVHRVLNRHVLDCGESQTVAEIAAVYRSEERKEATKANAADNAASRAHNARILADAERTREADDRIHSVLVAQGHVCRRPGCADCKKACLDAVTN